MLSEEEFTVFQNQLVELGQENFKLKEQLDNLQAANAELPKLKQQIEQCEKQRDEMRMRHTQSVDVLKEELGKLQQQAAEVAATNSKRVSDRITEVNQQITEVQKQTKDKEGQLEQLKQQLKTHELRIQQKSSKLETLKARAQKYIPVMKFLENSRAMPMYIEDLNSRIYSMRKAKEADEKALAELDQKVTDLHRENDDLGKKIKDRAQDIADSEKKLKLTQEKISAANSEIESTKKAIAEAEMKLTAAKEAQIKIIGQRNEELQKIKAEREQLEAQIKEQEAEKVNLQSKISELHAKTEEELSKHNEKIAKLRKKLNNIKETGTDDEIPRVDKELQEQINRIIDEKASLKDKSQMLLQAIELVKEEIRDKDLEIQTLTLKQPPTAKILAMPEFQQKQLLLEELVLQNKELKNTFSNMTERIAQMKEEAAKLRKAIQEKSK